MRSLICFQFKIFYQLSQWYKHHFTVTGYWVIGGMLLALMVGINTRISFGSQIFAFLLVSTILDAVLSLYFKPKLLIKRVLPTFTTSGDSIRYHFEVENLSAYAESGITIEDDFGLKIPGKRAFKHYIDPLDKQRNWFDRKVGYPKWLGLVRLKRGADIEKGTITTILANQSQTVPAKLTTIKRGLVQFEGYLIKRPGPLGIFNAVRRVPDQGQLLVLPTRYPVASLDLQGQSAHQPIGSIPATCIMGGAHEFFGLREYQPGDAKRDIHWKSWAKTGKPVIKEYRPEHMVRHGLVLDTSVSAEFHAEFETGISIAASYLCTLDTKESLLDLIFIGTQAFQFTLGQGFTSSTEVLKVLATVKRSEPDNIDRLASLVTQHSDQLSGCILLLSCWDEKRQKLVNQLQFRHIKVLVLIVTTNPIKPQPNIYVLNPADPMKVLSKLGKADG